MPLCSVLKRNAFLQLKRGGGCVTTKAFLEKRGDRVLDGGKILKMRLMEAEKGRGRMRREKEAACSRIRYIYFSLF